MLLIFLLLNYNIHNPKEQIIKNQFDNWVKEYKLKKNKNINVYYNNKVKYFLDFYTQRAKKYFEITLGRGNKFKKIINEELKQFNLPKELYLLPFIESSYNHSVTSSAKARGLWQLMSFTAKSLGSKIDVFIDERNNVRKSTQHALDFINYLYNNYKDWRLTLAAYNCGPGCVNRTIRKVNSYDYDKIKEFLPKETQNYIPKFMAVLAIYKNQKDFNIEPKYQKLEKTFKFELKKPILLRTIAKISKLTLEEVQLYNPELTTLITPPNLESYNVNLPIKVKNDFIKNYDKIKNESEKGFIFHKLRSGQTLSHLSRYYGTSIRAILLANEIKNANKLQINQKILIPIDPKNIKKNHKYKNKSRYKKYKLVYKVKKNDSFWSIARKHKITVLQLKKLNPRINTKKLSINENIIIKR